MTVFHSIERIEARILDIPTIRPHKLSFGAISRQSPVIVQLWLSNGACGFGEAATIGGPSWNEESPESIKHAIDGYLAPALIGQDGSAFGGALARMDAFCKGNHFAKSAVEMALIDAVVRQQPGALGDEQFGLIVANPPYIAAADPHLEQGDVRFEPRSALTAGADGLSDLRRIIDQAPEHLQTGGWLLLEHGWDQADAVAQLLRDRGFLGVAHRHDLGGHARCTGAQWDACRANAPSGRDALNSGYEP